MELTSIPLALIAGALSILSPCVWPLVPVVMSSAATSGRTGPLFLALGLSLSFAAAGSLLTFVLVSAGLDPEFFRYIAAALLIAIGLVLLIGRLNDWVTLKLSSFTAGADAGRSDRAGSAAAQFGVGALLGLVWLPCVGPTLGAAIALASLGQDLGLAFLVMLAFGAGTGFVLLAASILSTRLLSRLRPGLMSGAGRGKKILGWTLLVLGLLVLTGFDKILEALAIRMLPEWIFSL